MFGLILVIASVVMLVYCAKMCDDISNLGVKQKEEGNGKRKNNCVHMVLISFVGLFGLIALAEMTS